MSRVVDRWLDMIKINSINGYEVDLANFIAKELNSIGMKPNYSYFEDDKNHVRPSVWSYLDSGKKGETLMLIGHIDTVDVARGWNTDPFSPTEDPVEAGKVYGLGSMDMKGGLSSIIETLSYYSNHKEEFTGKIIACFVSDEEGLSKGTYQLVDEGISADYAIMAECRYDNVAIGFRGRYSFEVIVHGEAAHASKYPDVGENALITGGKLAAAIEKLPTLKHKYLKHGTWCIRALEGGNKGTLVVPDLCSIFVDRYVVPGEDDKTCIRQIKEAAQKLGLEDKVDIRLKPRQSPYMKPFALDKDHKLVVSIRKHFKDVTGDELKIEYDPSVCDSNILAVTLNIPTITFGPSGGGMHSPNEYGYKWQVENCAEIYKRMVRDILN
ncbi:MAG: M20/M25/M40 family metallo-hydrolase [Clostridiales bacterium]|nr:M20/M25/M40 family metallo-hydrolase [Clostridiales bacterium]